MSHMEVLRTLVSTRLSAAAEEICGLLENILRDYEQEISRHLLLQRSMNETSRKIPNVTPIETHVPSPTAGMSNFTVTVLQAELPDTAEAPLQIKREQEDSCETEQLQTDVPTIKEVLNSVDNTDIEKTVKFRVLIDQDIKKLTLISGIPSSVEELIVAIKKAFSIPTEIGLQYKDAQFGDFLTLTSISDLKDKDTLKVVYVPPAIILTMVPQESNCDNAEMSSADDVLDSDDAITVIPMHSERKKPWPGVFPIPVFSYNTELSLKQGNENYRKHGTLLTSQCVKSDILERLAEAMFSYTAYPNEAQRSAVALALIEKHPCLREPGCVSGCYGWLQSLKYKCGNYRSKLRAHGRPELVINSLKHKRETDKQPAKNVKKARKAEVNYLPPHPTGETDDSLENVRHELMTASQKKDNGKLINGMMSRTYSLRRMEVVSQSPRVAAFKERWPALFEPFQINEEFQRCNAIPLESTFMSQLDKYTPKLLALFNAKGGGVGQRIKNMMMELIKDPCATVEKKRDVTLRCLIEYIGENGEELITDYHGVTESDVLEDPRMLNMRIYVCRQPDAVGIIIEGTQVLSGLGNVARACCLLLGLTYALNLDYPPKLQYTFEVFQRLFVGLDTLSPKPTFKYISLKNKLLA